MKNINDLNIEELTNLELVDLEGGVRYPEAYQAGKDIGDGLRRGLAIIGIYLLFV
ncbi:MULTISPECIES: hypothetical protein [Sphingobacterium]|uniref:hypothetical protein n=1 Tax=Sphingobacterium TaxID=28453 RepID=UPI0022443CAD|nr:MULTISPECIES: hypothetical protein [Sphingobacterium]MCW8310727.1 hypothetical protein [Sphingobacterium sp. InxBP1]